MVLRRLIYVVVLLLQVLIANAQQNPNEMVVKSGAPVTLRVNNPDGNFTYQWYRAGRAMPGETRPVLIVTVTGEYQVLAINQGNCASDLSDVFSVRFINSDLQVVKKSEAKHVGPNETFEYYITARNNGNSDNRDIVVTDRLPTTLRFMGVDRSAAVYEEGVITWNIPSLAVGQEEMLTVKVQGKVEGYVVNTASIQSNGDLPDLVPENNTSTDTKRIIGNIKVPNVITPNGDGKNDVLKVDGIELYKENTIAIFNRWGNEVFRSQGGYQNNWDGNGLSEGTYFYVLKLVSRDGVSSSKTGYITLLRDK